MKYLKLLVIIGVFIVGIITLGEATSQSFEEVCISLKEISNESNIEESEETNINKNTSKLLSEPITDQSIWEFIKANKWYILIGGIAIAGIAVIAYKNFSSENISGDNTSSTDENISEVITDSEREDSSHSVTREEALANLLQRILNDSENENDKPSSVNTDSDNKESLHSIYNQYSQEEESINTNSQLEGYESEEIQCVVMGIPKNLSDLSESNYVKFVVPEFVKPHEFTTADAFKKTIRLNNGVIMFLKHVSTQRYINFSEDEAERWLEAWVEYHNQNHG